MRRIIFSLMMGLLSLTVLGQTYNLSLSGTITDDSTSNPLPGQIVQISIPGDSLSNDFIYFNVVFTNESGFYQDIIDVPIGTEGMVYTETFDCNGNLITAGNQFTENNSVFVNDFEICGNPGGGGEECQAMFDYWPGETPLTLNFIDMSFGYPDSWSWDFGDGNISTDQNPIHEYMAEGEYFVTLTISSDSTACTSTYAMPLYVGNDTIWPGDCQAMFDYWPGEAPLTMNFIDVSFGNPESWSWDFGDGDSSTDQNPIHEFPAEGEYFVTLTISSDSNNCASTYAMPVYVGNDTIWPGECAAMYFYYSDSTNYNTINFVDLSMGNNGDMPSSWSWEFGDGTGSDEQNPTHSYNAYGDYEVCLTITSIDDITGDTCESIFCSIVNVIDWDNECQASFYYYPEGDPVNGGLDIQFIDYSWGNPNEWSWDFGDGSTSNEQNPIHSFDTTGIYQVCLSISSDSCQSTYCEEVFVFNDTIFIDCFSWFEYTIDNLTVDFSGYSDNMGDSLTYEWTFGDGETAVGQNVTHTYSQSGIYYVELFASSADSSCISYYSETVWIGDNLSFSVYGNIYLEDSLMADYANVSLMTFDTLGQDLVSYATTQIDANGYYQFDEVALENCMYFVQAELTDASAYYGDYLPTYHFSALNWEYALPVFPFPTGYSYDVYMIADSNLTNTANGTIEGVVNSDETRGLMSNVEILLLDDNSNPITYLRTDENGNFNFSDLPYGTYIVYTEIVGIETTPAYITLTEDNPHANITIVVTNGEALLSTNNQSAIIEKLGDVTPNPVSQDARLSISLKEATTLKIEIINQLGQIVLTENNSVNSGENHLELQTGKLNEGLYILSITPSDGISSYKKFIKLR